jgi:hypothetical protein
MAGAPGIKTVPSRPTRPLRTGTRSLTIVTRQPKITIGHPTPATRRRTFGTCAPRPASGPPTQLTREQLPIARAPGESVGQGQATGRRRASRASGPGRADRGGTGFNAAAALRRAEPAQRGTSWPSRAGEALLRQVTKPAAQGHPRGSRSRPRLPTHGTVEPSPGDACGLPTITSVTGHRCPLAERPTARASRWPSLPSLECLAQALVLSSSCGSSWAATAMHRRSLARTVRRSSAPRSAISQRRHGGGREGHHRVYASRHTPSAEGSPAVAPGERLRWSSTRTRVDHIKEDAQCA